MKDTPTRPRRRPFSGPTTALLWEQGRMYLPFLFGAVFTSFTAAAGMYINLLQKTVSLHDAVGAADAMSRGCAMLLPALFCVTPGSGIAFPARMYRLPVTTRRMVLYMVAMRLMFLLATLLAVLGVRMLFFGMPHWDVQLRMMVISVEALLAGMALTWALGAVKDWLAVVALMLVVVAAALAFEFIDSASLRSMLTTAAFWIPYGPLSRALRVAARDLSGAALLWAAALSWAAVWGWAVFAGPVRARSGYIAVRRPWQRARSSTPTRPARVGARRRKPFASPFEAQVWYERRSRGYAGMLYPLVFIVAVAYLWLKPFQLPFQLGMRPQFLPLSLAVLVAGACFIATAWRRLHEAYRVRTGRFRFFAAKPVSTQDMARARLHAMFRAAEAAVLFTLAVCALLWLLPPMPLLLTPRIWPLWVADAYQTINATILLWILTWLLLVWLSASLNEVSTPLALVALVAYPLLRLGSVYAPVAAIMDNGGDEAVIALTGLVLMGHALFIFVRACRRRFLSPITALLSLVAYVALVWLLAEFVTDALGARGFFLVDSRYAALMLLTLGLFALAVAPIAALPLQFDRWRHGGK